MMVKDMCGMIGIEGKMNHSHRATDASEIFQACVPKKIVQKRIVHCSIKAHARSQGGSEGSDEPSRNRKSPLLHSLVVVYHSRTLHGIHA